MAGFVAGGAVTFARMDLDALLWEAVERGASDLHLRAGGEPVLRIDSAMYVLDDVEPCLPLDNVERLT